MVGRNDVSRLFRGARWGLVATAIMSLGMELGTLLSRGRLAPFPLLIAAQVLGHGHGHGRAFPLGLLTVVSHFAYGTLAGLVFAFLSRPMTLAKGIGFGAFLWMLMEVTFVPWLGWSDFGLARGAGFTFYFLLLHLIYGYALGWLGARDERTHHARFDDLGRLSYESP